MGRGITDKLQSARFQLLRELGSGGMGVVYEAYDHQTDSVVALKTIPEGEGEALYRLKKEFRSLLDVQHPNLVRFGELLCEGGQWFFTMEVVSGNDFYAYTRLDPAGTINFRDATEETAPLPRGQACTLDAPGTSTPILAPRGYDEPRLRASARQLAGAIHALHRSGRMHRDLKPANVLVRDDGHLVLLDFGLIEEVVASRATAADRGLVMGTPSFMAPEQADSEHVGPEADWYAFGVMLFLSLTGTLPHRGTPDQILEAKRRFVAPAPRELFADVPDDLNNLCRRLLEREPRLRPDAAAVLAALGSDEPSELSRTPTGETAEPERVFVGRTEELAVLHESFARVCAGQRASVILRGEPGVGKSTLLRHFLDRAVAREPRALILAGRCYEQETVPFKAFDAMIDGLSRTLSELDQATLEPLLASGVRFLASMFPVLKRVPAIAERVSASRAVPNPASLRAQGFAELAQLLTGLAEKVALVLFVDDLQWADRDSLALLHALLLSPLPVNCLFIATLRPDGVAPRELPALQELQSNSRMIDLTGLSRDESRSLCSALFGDARRATRELDALLDEAAGHPLFLSEMIRHLQGVPRDEVGALHLTDVLWQRISALEEPARRFLELVALAGAPIPYPVIAQAAEIDGGTCLHLLGDLRSTQLIRISRRGSARLVEPYHDRIRQAIVGQRHHPDGAPLQLRLRLGRALHAATPAEELPTQVFAIVQHLNAASSLIYNADERRQLAELNLLAGHQAKLATAYEAALGYLERGLTLLDGDPWHSAYTICRALHTERMEAEHLAGHRERAQALFTELRARVRSEVERTDLYVCKIGLDTGVGQFNDAIAAAREALRKLGVRLPRRATVASLLWEYAWVRRAQGTRKIGELLSLPELTDVKQQCVMRLLMAVAPAAFFVSTELVTVCLMRIARLSMENGVSDASAYGLAGFGAVLAGAFGKCHGAHAFGQLALQLNERFRNDQLASKLYFLNGTYLTAWARPFAQAREQLRLARTAAVRSGDTAYEAYSAATSTLIDYCDGADLRAAEAHAERALVVTRRHREQDMSGIISAQLRFAAALSGKETDPLALNLPRSDDATFLASLSDAQTPIAMFYYHHLRAELALLFGELKRARTSLAQAHKREKGIFSVPVTVDLLLLDALLAARAWDTTGFVARRSLGWTLSRRCEKLAHFAEACPQNFAAHHRLAAAEMARVHGDRARAIAEYANAIEAARSSGTRKREALALELTSRFYRAEERTAEADTYLAQAISAYRLWGASAKADALARR